MYRGLCAQLKLRKIALPRKCHMNPRDTRRCFVSAPELSSPKGPIGWKSFALLVVVGTGAVVYYQYELDRQQTKTRPTKYIGTAVIGGPFELINSRGETVTEKNYSGKYVLVYFGFTSCPDICPTELRKMSRALEIVDRVVGKDQVLPLFISIDPDRDTPQKLEEYKKSWNPRTEWLTGSMEQITKAAKAFRVYFSMPELEKTQDDYLVDHSIFFYLMDPQWKFMDFYGKQLTAEEVAEKMARSIVDHKRT